VVSFGGVLAPDVIFVFTATIAIYHDIQYFIFVRHEGRKLYGATDETRRPFGFAGTLAIIFPLFMAAGIGLTPLPIWGFPRVIGRVDVCPIAPHWGEPTFLGDMIWILFFAAASVGVQMQYYVLDMHIWRPGKNVRLREESSYEAARSCTRRRVPGPLFRLRRSQRHSRPGPLPGLRERFALAHRRN